MINIDMNGDGFRVITYSAAMKDQGGITYLCGGNSGNAEVDGFGFHVLAVELNAVSMLAQVVVAPRCSIAAHDIDHAVRTAETGHQIVQQVEFLHIVGLHCSRTMIAQKVVQSRHGTR